MDLESDNMVTDDNAPLPESAIMALSVRARHTLERMTFPKTFGGIKSITYEKVMSMQNAGAKTAREIMELREKCLTGSIVPDATSSAQVDSPPEPIRIDEPLPPLAVERLPIKARNILEKYGIALTPRGICALDRETVKGFNG